MSSLLALREHMFSVLRNIYQEMIDVNIKVTSGVTRMRNIIQVVKKLFSAMCFGFEHLDVVWFLLCLKLNVYVYW